MLNGQILVQEYSVWDQYQTCQILMNSLSIPYTAEVTHWLRDDNACEWVRPLTEEEKDEYA